MFDASCFAAKVAMGLIVAMIAGILAVIFAPLALWLKRREQQGERR